jgi:hypothetical protein
VKVKALLYCGDHASTINGKFDLIMAMPPLNVGDASAGVRRFRGVRSYYDSMPEPAYQAMIRTFVGDWVPQHLKPGGRLIIHHKSRRKNKRLITPHEFLTGSSTMVLQEEYHLVRSTTHNKNPITAWPCHDYLLVFCRSCDYESDFDFYRQNSDELGNSLGPSQRNWWTISFAGCKRIGSQHDGPMPNALAYRCIKKYCPPGGTVCDPYMGIGTTMVVSLELGRSFVGSELKRAFYEETAQRLRSLIASRDLRVKTNL